MSTCLTGKKLGVLSGAPAHARALEVMALLRAELGTTYPLIGVGGIDHPDRAHAMVAAWSAAGAAVYRLDLSGAGARVPGGPGLGAPAP